MLDCIPYPKLNVTGVKRECDYLTLIFDQGIQRIIPVDDRSIRVIYTQDSSISEESINSKPGLIELKSYSDWTYEESETAVILNLPKLKVVINKKGAAYTYYDEKGNLLLKERKDRSKELDKVPVYAMSEENIQKEYVDTADGRKEVIRQALKTKVRYAFKTRINLVFDDNEALFGLGQHEEGYRTLKGKRIFLNQGNRKIAIPMIVSTKGYGLLVNTYSPSIFNDAEDGTYFFTEADHEMDFFFMNGSNDGMYGVIREYRKITGKAAMLPKWAFGYIQSQERYEDQDEIIRISKEYRDRNIGLDCIVLDWCSWEDGKWGQKTFDASRFPDPDAMTDELHKENVHFMISIWPNVNEGTDNYNEFKKENELLPGINIYNALSPKAREMYWKQASEGLFEHGIDAWWCDNSEPIAPEWNYTVKPEASKIYDEYVSQLPMHIPAEKTNAFGLYHAMGIYEGQRGYYKSKASKARDSISEDLLDRSLSEQSILEKELSDLGKTQILEKRVVNLTRSGYIGQQRYGTILWSGDISASWDTFRRQIAAGLHFSASGLPYWTTDIGAFFVKNGIQWYWNGDYDLGPKDPAYCELFTRWYQWAVFLPIFRGHGTDFRRELWQFQNDAAPFYEAIVKANHLRYELMPYIYSLAGAVWHDDTVMIRPLAFEFTEDERTWDIMDQYMFGQDMMVCPVTDPMIFDHDQDGNCIKIADHNDTINICEAEKVQVSTRNNEHNNIQNPKKVYIRKVYLPKGYIWRNFYTGESYEGGQWIETQAPLDIIPVFVKAGAIIPMTTFKGHVQKEDEITLKIFGGADGSFALYEDEGDGYDYEKGAYTITKIEYIDLSKKVTINGVETKDKDIRFEIIIV